MKLIQSYSLQTGLKINKPEILPSFFPLPHKDKSFITIHTDSGMPSKNYDYWQEVVNLLLPILKEKNINIIQLGAADSPKLNNITNLCGITSIRQSYYILSKALLHISGDSFLAHCAGFLNIPLVEIFGPTSIKNHSPYWINSEKTLLIESDRNGKLPSYSNAEPQESKVINLINPEKIVNAALYILGLPQINRESLYFGKLFNNPALELVCDHVLPKNVFEGTVPLLRLDYTDYDDNVLAGNLQTRPHSIYTNKQVNLNILKQFKKNVANIIVEINGTDLIPFIKDVIKTGINTAIITFLSEEDLTRIKLDFLDIGPVHKNSKNNINDIPENIKLKINENTLFQTKRLLLSNSRLYRSKLDWTRGLEMKDINDNISKFEMDEDFIGNELQFLYIFND